MWDYLLVLWDDFIEKADTAVKEDKNFQELFWHHVLEVWEHFKEYMQNAEDEIIELFCGPGMQEQSGGMWNEEDQGICGLTLIALSFKYGLHLGASGETPQSANTGADGIIPYMKCILVNIFMKKIVGEKCLETAGGRQAFEAAQALMTAQSATPRNTTCEGQDLQSGDSSQNPDNWTLLHIMRRWFERNKTRLRDGDVGVLGSDCKVHARGRASDGEALKEDIKKEIGVLGKDITDKVQQILPEVRTCTDNTCVKGILEKKNQEEGTSRSRTPGVQQAAGSQGPQPTTPSSSTSPGTSEPGTADNVAGAVATHADGSKPAATATAETTPSLKETSVPAPKPAATKPATSDTAVGRSQTPASPVLPARPPPPPPEPAGKQGEKAGAEAPTPKGPGIDDQKDKTTGKDSTANTGTQDPQVPAEPAPGPVPPSEASAVTEPRATGGAGEVHTTSHPGFPIPDKTCFYGIAHSNCTKVHGSFVLNDDTDNTGTGRASPGTASSPSITNTQSTRSNKKSGTNDFVLGSDPPQAAGDLGGHYAPGPPQVPHTVHPKNVPSNDDGPDVPDLTGTVLTATTPVLAFVTLVIVALLGYSLWKASTLGTSSGNETSQIDTEDAATVGTTTVSLSGEPDIGKRGQRNFYDAYASGAPKNRVFVDMLRKFKPRDKVNEPRPIKSKPQGATAQNKLKQLCQKLKQCKMGRRAWIKLIVVLSVLYSFCMSSAGQSTLNYALVGIFTLNLQALSYLAGLAPFIVFTIIYLCVLLRFCRSKRAKCLLDKIWKKKKKKEEGPTETKNNEGKVNKKPETPGKQKVPGKPEVPNKQEASGILEVPKKPETPGKSDVPQKQETPKKPEVPNKHEASGILSKYLTNRMYLGNQKHPGNQMYLRNRKHLRKQKYLTNRMYLGNQKHPGNQMYLRNRKHLRNQKYLTSMKHLGYYRYLRNLRHPGNQRYLRNRKHLRNQKYLTKRRYLEPQKCQRNRKYAQKHKHLGNQKYS
ncbi:hypothetical protein AK88_05261 [Plasmodium fragile]|uniref:Uncharacterized protein n=1 Tax=Plasmodium fragile TaxID=5857 RepID=A0A0D9QDS7_PLAFR|nr:uncharacterized protein AK88_05261 [Plasmodium fragile]KJP85109.1 hypothetical protein AK88_05261 [Plasmodium fragile]